MGFADDFEPTIAQDLPLKILIKFIISFKLQCSSLSSFNNLESNADYSYAVCYLYDGVSPRWSALPGNPDQPCHPVALKTEGPLLQFLSLVQIVEIKFVSHHFPSVRPPF